MSVRERFIEQIEGHAQVCIDKCNRAEQRGYFTVDELEYLDNTEESKLPIALTAYGFAAEDEGKRVPDRSQMIPDPRKRKGLHVSNKGERPALYVYGAIGARYGGITAEDFQSGLSGIDARAAIDIHVHSSGGSFADGCAIYSLINDLPGRSYGYVDGSAASAGSLLLMACDTITMARASQQMIHYASIESEGSWNESELERVLDVVKETNRQLLGMYSPRWKGTAAELDAALKKETYYGPEQAVAVGLADYVSDSVKVAAYAVTTGYHSPSFSLSASEGPHKHFNLRRAGFQIWQMVAQEMRDES